jgi:hypothetical protein
VNTKIISISLGLFIFVNALYPQGSIKVYSDLKSNTQLQEEYKLSSKRNILYSLILPGAGEWGMGRKNRAKFFFGTEFLLWIGYFGVKNYTNILQNNYQSYAAHHAGVITANKNEQYWIDIGSSLNIYDFNQQKLIERDRRALYPETDLYYWQWDSENSVRKYNAMRVKEHDWEQRATLVVGGLVLNRIISAIDVIWLLRKEKKAKEKQFSQIYLDYRKDNLGEIVYCLNFKMKW